MEPRSEAGQPPGMVATVVMLVLLVAATVYCSWAIAQGAAGLAADRRLQETAVALAGVVESVAPAGDRGAGLVVRYRLVDAPDALWEATAPPTGRGIEAGAPLTVWVDRADPAAHFINRDALRHRAWALMGLGGAIGVVVLGLWVVAIGRVLALRRHRRAAG